MIGFIVLFIAIAASIVWLWSGGINYIHKKHPDYKGDDFLDFDKKVNKIAGRDSWDDLHDEIY
jgi:hypothetical protein